MSTTADQSQWIRSPLWDGFWMFSGLWAPALAVIGYFALTYQASEPLTMVGYGLSIKSFTLVWVTLAVTHRISSIYGVLATPLLRDDVREHKARYLYVPLGIVVGCLLLSAAFVFHPVFSFMPNLSGQLWGFFALAYVMILWERWHFCAQEFGVLSIFRARAGQRDVGDRSFDRFYTVFLMLFVNMVLFACLGFPDERHVLLHGTRLESQTGGAIDQAATMVFALGMLVLVVALIREFRHPHRSVPKALFYLLIGSHTLLLYFFPAALGVFFLGYMFHHWMVAVGLFGRVMMNSYDGSAAARFAQLVIRFGPVILLSVAVYQLYGSSFNKAGSLAPVPSALAFDGWLLSEKLSAVVLVGLFFAINYLHYYYDRCFYSLGNPAVRKSVGAILLGQPRAG